MKQELQSLTRFAEGVKVALYSRIIKVKGKQEWWVYSLTKAGKFYIVKGDGSCTCPDYKFRGLQCKHALGVDLRFSVMHEIREIEA